MHTRTSPVQKGEGPRACHMHKHVMWAVCDVSVVQPHLYFGLSGWGLATVKFVPMYAHSLLFKKGRGQGRATSIGMSCGLCVMSE